MGSGETTSKGSLEQQPELRDVMVLGVQSNLTQTADYRRNGRMQTSLLYCSLIL